MFSEVGFDLPQLNRKELSCGHHQKSVYFETLSDEKWKGKPGPLKTKVDARLHGLRLRHSLVLIKRNAEAMC